MTDMEPICPKPSVDLEMPTIIKCVGYGHNFVPTYQNKNSDHVIIRGQQMTT